MTRYLFDSYAIIEVLSRSPNYGKYRNARVVLTQFNLFEVCYAIARMHGQREAIQITKKCEAFLVEVDTYTFVEAALLRLQLRKRSVSMTDCIGYCMALRLGIPFLTGDTEFKSMPNVEYVA